MMLNNILNIKVNGYTFKGDNSVNIDFAPFCKWSTLTKRAISFLFE